MKLTTEALNQIKQPRTRTKLAVALGVTDQTIVNYIKTESDNLTKAAALQVIREETGLSDDELLEAETAGQTY